MTSRDAHPAALPSDALLRECAERRVRRSGPGGQHRNKVETGVVLTHRPTGLSGEASERRSQADNRTVAVRRLRRTLAVEVRMPAAEPTSLWRSRTAGGRIAVNEAHDDFPTLLAEALDHLGAADWDAGAAAQRLGVTPSQLVRFLKAEPRAFARLNAERADRGLPPLR